MYRFAFAAAAAVLAAPVSAATVTLETTFANILFNLNERFEGGGNLGPAIVNAGDTLDVTIRFGQTVTLGPRALLDNAFRVSLLDTTSRIQTLGTATFELIDPTGDLIASGSELPGLPTIGEKWFRIAPPDQTFSGSFTGIRIVYQVTSGPADIQGANVFAAAIPEPATWAMIIAGFGMAGAAMRRRVSYILPSR